MKNYLDLVNVCSYIYARNWLYKWGVRAMENLFRVILNQDFPSRHPDYVFRAFLDQILEIAEMSWRRKKLRSEMMHKGRNSAVYPDYGSGCAFF